jgi:hypothetical protein
VPQSTERPGPTVKPVLELELGERLELRKPHPCGSRTWRVVRLGADIGLVCEGCGRRVLLERPDLERRLTRRLGMASEATAAPRQPAEPT